MPRFNSMTNKELLKIAEKEGKHVSLSVRNTLLSFRGVENDTKGDAARQSIISDLRIYKKTKQSFVISILSILLAVISLIVAVFK
ncbi:MAG: hypothetical protein KAI67_05385 [Candidatus Pacebacteria bacterium]|nr:hypothetical protein [Candidatus Paceibacterota bacterium]